MLEVRSPADQCLLATLPVPSSRQVTDRVEALRAAQPGWEALGPRGRSRWLRALRDWMQDNERLLADAVRAETGKVRADASAEVPIVAAGINYYTRHAASFLKEDRPRPAGVLSAHKRLRVRHRAYPVVGIIAPWNFPLITPVLDATTALLAGSAVLLKPSELTPLAIGEVARGWTEIGAPPVFELSIGGPEVGAAVVEAVDFVQFTGSTATGREIARRCADRLVPYGLELGGKDAAIVLEDADLDRAVPGIAWGGMFNAGQACTSIERVFVVDSVHDEFVRRLTVELAAVRVSDSMGVGEIGSMASERQRTIVSVHLADARAMGAQVHSSSNAGLFLAPKLVLGADDRMVCMSEETFGPTIPVIRVADEMEAIQRANASRYGLSASVWSRDLARARRVADRIEAGAVNINDAIANSYAFSVPQGGWKESGIGARFGGRAGLLKYTRGQVVTSPRLPWPKREPGWFPYTERRTRRTAFLLSFTSRRGTRRLAAFRRKDSDVEKA